MQYSREVFAPLVIHVEYGISLACNVDDCNLSPCGVAHPSSCHVVCSICGSYPSNMGTSNISVEFPHNALSDDLICSVVYPRHVMLHPSAALHTEFNCHFRFAIARSE